MEWRSPCLFLASDHVHLGPGVQAQRQTNPAVDLEDLPRIDVVLLSHYHADHFDQLVQRYVITRFFSYSPLVVG